MNKHERDDFRLFCRQATPSQLREIVRREREAAVGSEYRETCAEIAGRGSRHRDRGRARQAMNAPESALARAEHALSEGDVETAINLLAVYAEHRGNGAGSHEGDRLWEILIEIALEMGAL